MFGKYRDNSKDSDNDEVARAMNVLEGGSAPNDAAFEPHILVKDIEPILWKKEESLAKIDQIKSLVDEAKQKAQKDKELAILQRTIEQQRKQIDAVRSAAREGPRRQATFKRHSAGLYISQEDANVHPLIKSSSLVKMVLILLAVILIVQPFFIAISADVQTMSIAFFVLILLIGGFAVLNFFETREQELRMFFGESDDALPENREQMLNYSLGAFSATMFAQLVYALMSARTAVSMVVVVFLTLASCATLLCSYACLVRFENKYVIAN